MIETTLSIAERLVAASSLANDGCPNPLRPPVKRAKETKGASPELAGAPVRSPVTDAEPEV